MRIRDFEFNLRELAGSMGDFGTLFPFAIGYIAINGLNPASLLVMMGLANIATGLIYRLPMPIEPKKVLGVVAISQHWSPSLVYAAGFATGAIWLILTFTGLVRRLAALTPRGVVRGIQLALGIMLAIEGIKLLSSGWALGIIAVAVVLVLRDNRYAPASLVLMALGLGVMGYRGELRGAFSLGLSLPTFTTFTPSQVFWGLVLAGLAQIPLTLSNAVIATSALLKQYFPEKPVPEERLALNQGVMNVVVPFFGGMPMCHGAGGLAGQYYFGARTGGTNIIEGVIEISLGLFLAGSIGALFGLFPRSILGAMLLLVGIELTKFIRDIKLREAPLLALTAGLSLGTNMAIGYGAGVAAHWGLRKWGGKSWLLRWMAA